MGGLVHWWEEWQLRVLVLCSMAIQWLLFGISLLRRRAIPGWLRFTLWLAYLASDAVAIYALATLFNRHKGDEGPGAGGGRRSSMLLEVVWAPILLLHLGGLDGITAYNIEDNELWTRHLFTAVSQVTVAIYVFCKTWPPGGDKRLLQAAIVLFVPGVLKCFQKPWALKSASIYSLVRSPEAVEQKDPMEEYVKRAKDLLVREETTTEEAASTSSPVEDDEADRCLPRHNDDHMESAGTSTDGKVRRRATAETIRGQMFQARHNYETCKLFVDLSSSYSCRLRILEDFCGLTEKRAYGSVRQGLATAFLLLYTKLKTVNLDQAPGIGVKSYFSAPIDLSRLVLPWAAIGLFHHSHREAYNDIDVKITYVILCCTAALEYSSIGFFICRQISPTGAVGEEWPEMVSQYSLIGYFARNMKPETWIVSLLGCNDFLDQHWCMKSCFSSRRISQLVLGYLKDGWKEKIHDATSYCRFNNHRSSEGLSMMSKKRENKPLLFDESVLVWHIATDFCFFSTEFSTERPSSSYLCRQMSNYMAYLLFVNPEMLLPGSRRNIFTTAHQELQDIFNDDNQPLPLDNEGELTREIIMRLAGSDPRETTIIQEARVLARKLRRLRNEKKMWEVIQGVWVEMLCFSASRCRGYLHAKALGSGGEFLSYVWLMLFYMGMETFTDKLQREDIPSHEATGSTGTANNATAGPTTLTTERVSSTTGVTAASASEAHAGAAGASATPTSEIHIAQDYMV